MLFAIAKIHLSPPVKPQIKWEAPVVTLAVTVSQFSCFSFQVSEKRLHSLLFLGWILLSIMHIERRTTLTLHLLVKGMIIYMVLASSRPSYQLHQTRQELIQRPQQQTRFTPSLCSSQRTYCWFDRLCLCLTLRFIFDKSSEK